MSNRFKKEIRNDFYKLCESLPEPSGGLLACRNPCLVNMCSHSSGPDNNRCYVEWEFSYLGAKSLPTELEIQGETCNGHLPLADQPMSAQTVLYTDDTIEVQLYYMVEHHDEESKPIQMGNVILNVGVESDVLLSVEVDLVDFWEDDAFFVREQILEAISIRRSEAETFYGNLNCLATEKLLTEAKDDSLYDVLSYFYENLNYA